MWIDLFSWFLVKKKILIITLHHFIVTSASWPCTTTQESCQSAREKCASRYFCAKLVFIFLLFYTILSQKKYLTCYMFTVHNSYIAKKVGRTHMENMGNTRGTCGPFHFLFATKISSSISSSSFVWFPQEYGNGQLCVLFSSKTSGSALLFLYKKWMAFRILFYVGDSNLLFFVIIHW